MRDEERRRRERAAAVGGPEEVQRALGEKMLPAHTFSLAGYWLRAVEFLLPPGVRWRGLHEGGGTFGTELVRGEEVTWLLMANPHGPTLFEWRRGSPFLHARVAHLRALARFQRGELEWVDPVGEVQRYVAVEAIQRTEQPDA